MTETPNTDSDAVRRFYFRPAAADTIPLFEAVRAATIDYARILDRLLPDGREKARALTALEDVHYSANAAIARGA